MWERELGISYEVEEWSRLTEAMLSPMREARSKLIQFKVHLVLLVVPLYTIKPYAHQLYGDCICIAGAHVVTSRLNYHVIFFISQ